MHCGNCLDTLACKCGIRFWDIECFSKGFSERQSFIVITEVVEKDLGLSRLEADQSQGVIVLCDKDRGKFVGNVEMQLLDVLECNISSTIEILLNRGQHLLNVPADTS